MVRIRTKNIQSNTTRQFTRPLILVSLTFLILVLSLQSWYQWKTYEENFDSSVHGTIDNFINQSALTIKAAIHTNIIFTDAHGTELIALINNPDNSNLKEDIRAKMKKIFFNFTGYAIFDIENQLLLKGWPA